MGSTVFKYVYGPVPSRRLGRSLGLDLIPFKTCSYNCIYCQLGNTTDLTIERRNYVPADDVLAELKEKLASGITCDYISLAGSGEPTLCASTGKLIAGIKEMTDIPISVITNGALLYLPEVRRELKRADLVIPSLDAGDAALFDYVNRPHPDIVFERVVEGLIAFAGDFSGRLLLEVLLVSGVSGLGDEVKNIAALAEKIRPEKVQLGTVTRPALEDFACAVKPEQMKKLAGLFTGKVELLPNDQPVVSVLDATSEATDADILNLLARRPCSLEGIAQGLNLHPHDAAKRLKKLLGERHINSHRNGRTVFYKRSGRNG
ncbi:MAG: radical SAM protein [Smithella sp.]|nr:radical SAM protein [Smithella sp.]